MKTYQADVIVIGCGIAGLIVSELLSHEKNVIMISKESLENSNSFLAQGGIAASIDINDNWREHFIDTIVAGKNHNIEETTIELVKNAPKAIEQLVKLGVSFDRDEDNNFQLGREGGHNKHRIIHAGGDSTGKKISQCLIGAIEKDITIHHYVMAYDLIIAEGRCMGVIAKNTRGETILYEAQHTILATGGVGRLYTVTSNDPSITGDGIAMAYRAGVELVDLEFIQFHPTMLVTKSNSSVLISEAVRGEGARLINQNGEYIMENIHPLKDLAPRDIVARQIYYSLQKGDKIYLDISMIENFKVRFPSISQFCFTNGIDIKDEILPVYPGAHFIMGGIKTNIQGETSLPGLYAVGEVSCNGVHGANRLASNSLLEGLIFTEKLSKFILSQPIIPTYLPNINLQKIDNIILPTIEEIQIIMTENVGIIRNEEQLLIAKKWFEKYLEQIREDQIYLDVTIEQRNLINLLTVGWLVTTSALMRTESRGGHYRQDYPNQCDDQWLKHYIVRRRNSDE
ncbi:MAG: L-aspartate oxidase [Vulcanibacillus sp.]